MAKRWWQRLWSEESDDSLVNTEQKNTIGRVNQQRQERLSKVKNYYPDRHVHQTSTYADNHSKHSKHQGASSFREQYYAWRQQKQYTQDHTERKASRRQKPTYNNNGQDVSSSNRRDVSQAVDAHTSSRHQQTAHDEEDEERPRFEVSDVPSPVFGFRQRTSTSYKDLNGESRDMTYASYEALQRKYFSAPSATKKESQTAAQPAEQAKPSIRKATHDRQPISTTASEQSHESAHVATSLSSEERVSTPSHEKDDRSKSRRSEKAFSQEDKIATPAHTRGNNGYQFPSLSLLAAPDPPAADDDTWLTEQQEKLAETLRQFKVEAEIVGITKGPSVTRFEVAPAPGVKVSKIKNLNDDLKLSLAARDIRIEAPIPGKGTVGIEIPNPRPTAVTLQEMLATSNFQQHPSALAVALGLDIAGQPIITDLRKMPHGLISGATGSGKSVSINALLISLLYKTSPESLKLILIDPKMVELAPFQDIPHLAAPVINDAKEASLTLKWVVEEMERRYRLFADMGARHIDRFNQKCQPEDYMPFIVVVIDELADLMMVAANDVEASISRIAQKARACGIHLIIATQRPSVDVITGLIKANIPTRLAFSVSSQVDSRTILDTAGAERLLGNGDMLFVENGSSQLQRIQGNFVSDDDIDAVTEEVKAQGAPTYLFEKEQLQQIQKPESAEDELLEEAGFFVLENQAASASLLQRHFRIGYNRAARLIDMMEDAGMISEAQGSKPRSVLISEDEFLEKVLQSTDA